MYNIYDIFENYKFSRLMGHEFDRVEEFINNFSIYDNRVVMEGYLDDILDFEPVTEGVVSKIVEFIKACWRKIKEWLDKVIGLFSKRGNTIDELDKQIEATNKQGEQKVKDDNGPPKMSEKEHNERKKESDEKLEKAAEREKEKDDDVEDLSKPEKEEPKEKKSDEDNKPKNKKQIDIGDGEKFSYSGSNNNNDVGGIGRRKLDYATKEFGLVNGIKLDLSKFQQKCASTKDVLENCKLELEVYDIPKMEAYSKAADEILGIVNYGTSRVSDPNSKVMGIHYYIDDIKKEDFGVKKGEPIDFNAWVNAKLNISGKKSKKKISSMSNEILDVIENTSKTIAVIKKMKQDGEKEVNELIRVAEKRKNAKNEGLQYQGDIMEAMSKFLMDVVGKGFKAIIKALNRINQMCYAIAKRASAEYHSAVLK